MIGWKSFNYPLRSGLPTHSSLTTFLMGMYQVALSLVFKKRLISILCVCIHLCIACAPCECMSLWRPEEGIRTGITDDYELPWECWKPPRVSEITASVLNCWAFSPAEQQYFLFKSNTKNKSNVLENDSHLIKTTILAL